MDTITRKTINEARAKDIAAGMVMPTTTHITPVEAKAELLGFLRKNAAGRRALDEMKRDIERMHMSGVQWYPRNDPIGLDLIGVDINTAGQRLKASMKAAEAQLKFEQKTIDGKSTNTFWENFKDEISDTFRALGAVWNGISISGSALLGAEIGAITAGPVGAAVGLAIGGLVVPTTIAGAAAITAQRDASVGRKNLKYEIRAAEG